MELTAKALDALTPGSYTLLDLRDARSREYGGIPGAVAADADALLAELTPVVPSAQRIGTVGEYHGGKRILLR